MSSEARRLLDVPEALQAVLGERHGHGDPGLLDGGRSVRERTHDVVRGVGGVDGVRAMIDVTGR
jgi:hypothetical protein